MTNKKRLSIDDFMKERTTVLSAWKTGVGVELEEGAAYQKSLPESKRFSLAMKKAHEEKKVLIQPRAGVALLDDHIRLLKYLETEGRADLLPTTIDAYTRQNRYEE